MVRRRKLSRRCFGLRSAVGSIRGAKTSNRAAPGRWNACDRGVAAAILGLDMGLAVATTLPTTLIEAEIAQAGRVADELVRQLLTEDLLHIGIPLLHPDAGQVDARAKIKKLFEGAACFRAEILRAALNGHMPSRIALGELVQEVDEDKQPSELKAFAKACANPHHRWPARPGAKRSTNVYSDISLVMVLLELKNRFPNIPIASHSGRRVCHCDIAADAFNKHKDRIGRGRMNRGRVQKIWKRYKHLTIHRIGDSQFINAFN